jgi:hypothetical protein
MAETFLEEIYRTALIAEHFKETIEFSNKNLSSFAMRTWMEKILPAVKALSPEEGANFPLEKMLEATEHISNRSRFASIIEGDILPEIMTHLKQYTGIDVSDKEYRLISSRTGFLTLIDEATGLFYHSSFDPMWEAHIMAQEIYDPSVSEYIFFGGTGLGYLPYQVFCLSHESVRISIYETDGRIVDYAHSYGVIDWISEGQIDIVTGTEEELLDFFMKENGKECRKGVITPYRYEELVNRYGGRIVPYLINNEPCRKYKNIYGINYRKNREQQLFSADDLVISKEAREWVIVAAGPSLDDNIDYLSKDRDKKVIVAVNTVIKKLLRKGIKPDLIVALDANDQLVEHISGVEDELKSIPLLMHSLTNWKFVNGYKGPRYCFQTEDVVEQYPMHDMNCPVWKRLGPTVSCAALEAAYCFGAEKISLVGLDLGYPKGKMFAEGAAHENSTMDYDGIVVEAVDGEMIRTTSAFLQYKKEIEAQIRQHVNIPVINLSKNGALIKGCQGVS